MPIDPVAKKILTQIEKSEIPPLNISSLEDARKSYSKIVEARKAEDPEPVFNVNNDNIKSSGGDIPIRIYTPGDTPPYPMLVYFHGGGWVLGGLDSHDHVCRALTNAADCITFSVDYRLSPENKFPAAFNDCYEAILWISENGYKHGGNLKQLAVGGDSAGGNLAAAVTLKAGESGKPKIKSLHQRIINCD